MIDTPGFGEAVDNTECWTPILDYIEDQLNEVRDLLHSYHGHLPVCNSLDPSVQSALKGQTNFPKKLDEYYEFVGANVSPPSVAFGMNDANSSFEEKDLPFGEKDSAFREKDSPFEEKESSFEDEGSSDKIPDVHHNDQGSRRWAYKLLRNIAIELLKHLTVFK